MAEETIRYWGQTEAEREAAFLKDSTARAEAGWRVASRRTEFAFGRPGMDLVVTWATYGPGAGSSVTPGASTRAPAAAPVHFDLNAAIAAATQAMPDEPARLAPASAQAAPEPAPARQPAPDPQPAAAAEPAPALEPAPPSVPEPEATPGFGPLADDREGEVAAPGFTPAVAAETFGPNGQDVVWLLDGLAELDREMAAEIASACAGADEPRREAALRIVSESFGKPPYSGWMKAAEDLVDSWVESVGATGNDAVLYGTVASAAIDAVDALIVQDQLDADSFDALYGPWGSVMDPDDAADAADAEGPDDSEDPAEKNGQTAVGEADTDYGPNSELVIEFFRALQRVTSAQIDELVKTGTAEWESRLNITRGRLDDVVARKPEYRRQCDAALRDVDAWTHCRRGVLFDYADGGTSAMDRQAAEPAVVDAVDAIAMADLLEPDDAKDLYSGWAYAVGLPALPELDGAADAPTEADGQDANAAQLPGASDLGPNAEDLLGFFAALASLTPEQVAQLGTGVEGSDAARLDRSWGRAIEIAAGKQEYRSQLESIVREVLAWRDRETGRFAAYAEGAGSKADRERARNPVLHSAAALLFADLLDREDAERLYGPWVSVAGEPVLPEYSND